MTAKDDNGANVLYGVSHRDGITPVQIVFSPGGKITTDSVTTIEFDPNIIGGFQTENDIPVARGTSSIDNETVLPWVVNADTGAVLVDIT